MTGRMKKLLQINPVLRTSTSTGRIMREIGDMAMSHGWESYVAYSKGRDGMMSCTSQTVPVGNGPDVAWHGVVTRLTDRHGLASAFVTKNFVRKIESIRPDIVHIHNIHGYFLNYRILFDYLSGAGIPVVWTVHDCWLYTGHCYYYTAADCMKWQTGCGHCPQRGEFPASLFLDRSHRNWEDKRRAFTSMPHSEFVIVPVSKWLKEEMGKSFLKDCNFRVIHNGIDTEVFNIQNSESVKARYGLGNRHVILGVASIWSREKGLDDFLALSGMISSDEVLVLVGVTPEQKASLPENVIGITRTDNVHDLAALYSAAEVFANPTYQDNYPTVNLESIACGTPVVTYRTGGSPESVTPATGFVVETGDLKSLLESVRKIEADGKDSYRTACREYAEKNFRKEDRYAEYIRLYGELLDRALDR